MKCPRCESENIRRSQSQDSVWFRFVFQKMMRCQRCCYTFATPMWDRPVKSQGLAGTLKDPVRDELEVAGAAST